MTIHSPNCATVAGEVSCDCNPERTGEDAIRAEHTAGPWRVGFRDLHVLADDEKGPMKVCDIRGWGHLTGAGGLSLSADEAETIQAANARLIAAAPDLLQSVHDLLACIGLRRAGFQDDDESEIVTRAQTALAKTYGGAR